jgi:hypothetical protein
MVEVVERERYIGRGCEVAAVRNLKSHIVNLYGEAAVRT